MHLLVTGGAGFIGANFVHSTLAQRPGTTITVLDALTYAGSRESLAALDSHAGRFRLVQGDITDTALVDALVADLNPETDAVVHFAAETHVDNALADPEPFLTWAARQGGAALGVESAVLFEVYALGFEGPPPWVTTG